MRTVQHVPHFVLDDIEPMRSALYEFHFVGFNPMAHEGAPIRGATLYWKVS